MGRTSIVLLMVSLIAFEAVAQPGLCNIENGTCFEIHWGSVTADELVDVNVETSDVFGLTPLHYAAGHSALAVVAALIDAGADPKVRDIDGLTPLYIAAGFNDNPAVVAALIDAGADPKARDTDGLTPLHYAATFNDNPIAIAELLKVDVDLEARGVDGGTPLHYAAANNNPAVVATLLKAGADPRARNADSECAAPLCGEEPQPDCRRRADQRRSRPAGAKHRR